MEDPGERFFNAEQGGLIGPPVDMDRAWLEPALLDTGHPERQAPALHALINLWQQRGRSPEELEALASVVREDPVLLEVLNARTRPRPLSPDQVRRRQKVIRRREEVAAQRQDRLRDWQDWRGRLLAEPDEVFSPDRRPSLVANVYAWLRAGGQRNRRDVWDGEKVAAVFGLALKNRIQEAFREH